MKQNAKAHKEEECTSDWRNPEEELHTLVTVSLSGFGFFTFSQHRFLIYTVSTL
jgi:hypothetical protein